MKESDRDPITGLFPIFLRKPVTQIKAKAISKGPRVPLNGGVRPWAKVTGALWTLRSRARAIATQALKRGKLVAPSICKNCEKRRRLEMHHEDYAKPLEVVFLCRPCHILADIERRKREEL